MKLWIVTGGAGCGKSAFLKLLKEWAVGSIADFSCDGVARSLWTEPDVLSKLETWFDEFCEVRSGRLPFSRESARRLAFENKAARARLDAIMHPLILQKLDEARARVQKIGQANVFVAEVPLYYEIQVSIPADTVIVVAASRTVQRTRLIRHRNLDAATCEGLLNAQLPIEEKAKMADVVVWNDGSLSAMEAQASALLRAHWESFS